MTKVLLVDDDELASSSITAVLEQSDLVVSKARSVPEALQLIAKEKFDVLLNDLHMPGDGLTALSAMRQANPRAVTMLLSAFSDMDDATHAILFQPNEIAVEPLDLPALVEVKGGQTVVVEAFRIDTIGSETAGLPAVANALRPGD